MLFSKPYSGKSIGCFARLRYGNHHIIRVDNRSGIPELAGIFDHNRNMRYFLYKPFSYKSCMP